jgi:lipopolysaccharide biosynthesis glycosyltransferase
MDTDILVQNDLSVLFEIPIEDKIYALIEFNKTIESEHHGQLLFDFTKVDKHTPGRNAGVLLFYNTPTIRTLFSTLVDQLQNLNIQSPDQQLLNYLCVKQNLFGEDVLKEYIFLTYTHYPVSPNTNQTLIMNHFYGTMKRKTKIERMKDHMRHLLNIYISKTTMDNHVFNGDIYSWNSGWILFNSMNVLLTKWHSGSYRCINPYIYEVSWSNIRHILIFDHEYKSYTAIRLDDINIVTGTKIESNIFHIKGIQ